MPNYVGDALMAHAKAGCYRCERGDSLVDLDAQIVGEGALVLCKGCLAEAAEAAGLHLNRAAIDEIQAAHAEERRTFGPERVEELELQVLDLAQKLHISEETRKSLVEAFKSPEPRSGRRK